MTIKTTNPKKVGICPERLARINDVMNQTVDRGDLAGISTMIARKGEIVHFEQFGYQDRDTKAPITSDTIFRIYSMTKPVVATAFMTLYEQGKVDLYDPVSKFIPGFANLKVLERDQDGNETLVDLQQPVMIFHLLTHTSGLGYDCYEKFGICDLYRNQQLGANCERSLAEYVEKVCEFPLAFQPGSQWYYSIGIDIIARIIEIITDMPLIDFLQQTLFQPLGMNDTSFFVPEEKRSRVATVYGGVDLLGFDVGWTKVMDAWINSVNEVVDVSKTCPVDKPDYMRGGHGLKSTAMDYMTFCQMLLNQGEFNGTRILGRKTIELMHSNHLTDDLLPIGFEDDIKLFGYGHGLGSRVLINPAQAELMNSAGEYGWAGAANTYYWIDPKEEIIGLFMNQYMCNFSLIIRIFQNLTYQALL